MSTSGDALAALVRAHGGVITTAEALKAGLTRASLQWAGHRGLLHAVRRGVHTSGGLWQQASPRTRHLLKVLAEQRVHPELVACAASAALAHGLPIPFGPPDRPRLTMARDPSHRGARGQAAGALRRRSWLAEPEIQTLEAGIRATTPERTVLDCSREWERPWGLAIADAAVRQFGLVPAVLVAAANERAPAPGTTRARWVAGHTRVGVESPLESLARGVVVLAGLPEPTPQVWVSTRAGSFRVDLLDVENRLIIEADGKLKYTSVEDLWREKRREDALRESGFGVVRFTMNDYGHQPPWLAAYRRHLTHP